MRSLLITLVVVACVALAVSASAQSLGRPTAQVPVRPQQQSFDTSIGPVKITPLYHASVLIELPNNAIYIDPAKPAPLDGLLDATAILITDIHPDHMDANAIYTLGQAGGRGTRVVAPKAVLDDPKVARQVLNVTAGGKVLANGETAVLDNRLGWTVEAVPMYNIVHKMPNGEPYHPKGRGNGYILTFGDKRFYFSGDTEGTPEMRALKNIDVAFVCMNLPYTMSPEEAADAVKAFHPKIVIPYHYQGSDPQIFAKALEGTGIEVRLLDWYPKLPQ
jgi:L-ascorbate metabolism protein UlaG (beta-lactamase superfamily)